MNIQDLPVAAAPEDSILAHQRRTGSPARYVFFLVGLTVYIVAAWYFGWQEVIGAFAGADLPLIAVAGSLTAAGAALRMWKWRLALGPRLNPLGLYFISRSGGIWSPARVGEFLPLLWRRHRNTRVAGWILFDRVLEVLATLSIGLAALGALGTFPPSIVLALAVCSAAAAVAVVYLLARADLLGRMAQRFAPHSRMHRLFEALAKTSAEFRSYWTAPLGLASLTLAAKTLDLYAVVLIFGALNASVTFPLVAASKCAVAIISYIPVTPVTTGIPHAVQGWLMYEAARIPPELVLASVGIEAGIMLVVFSVTAVAISTSIRRATV